MTAKNTYSTFAPYADKVFVTDLDRGMKRTKGGILLTDDDMKEAGIRARWARVHSVGPKAQDIAVGEWVLVEHGRWSQKIATTDADGQPCDLWMIEFPKAVLLVADSDPRAHSTTMAPALGADA